ncbi:flagellar basal body L-ring protein FlgH [Candidatus Latescibacterota bacterium]
MIIGVLTAVFILMGGGMSLWAQDETENYASLYADVKARRVGDLLEVIISESNVGANNAQTSTSKQNAAETTGEATTGALSGLFPGVGGSIDVNSEYSGQASSTRRGTLSSRMTVRIIDVLPNGNLVIEGTKTMEINSDYEVVTISGVVDPRYISSSNTVYSSQIANAKIIYKGKGAVSDGNRIGLIGRLLNWVF